LEVQLLVARGSPLVARLLVARGSPLVARCPAALSSHVLGVGIFPENRKF
jgi:hypothetical protein